MEHKYRKTLITTLVLSGLYGNSSAEVIMDGSAGTAGEIKATTPDNVYAIDSTQGTVSGHNLFHSFSQFNVEQDHTANFTDSTNAAISNIIARVTGPDASHIDGTIQSSIPNADFYLLNPNGILFGDKATLNISGSFYASTANYLKFYDGYKLGQTVNPNMTFTSAAPSAFGFTTNTPGSINVNGSNLLVNEGNTLSIIGGDIKMDGATLTASDGVINVASTESQGEVTPATDGMQLNSFSELGNIDLINGSDVDVSGKIGGHVVIRGGSLTMDNSIVEANSTGSGTNDYTKNIDVVAKNSITLDNSSTITTNAELLSHADTKGISLSAPNVTINSDSSVESNTSSFFGSNSGDIDINSDSLTISGYGYIYSETSNLGKGGNITANTENLNIKQGGYIGSASSGDGDSGDITVNSDNISITGPEISTDPFGKDFTGIYSEKSNENSLGGNIIINNSDTITLDSRGGIFTDNYGAVIGGDIYITSQDINVLRGSQIGTTSDGDGNGGNVKITAGKLNLVGVHDNFSVDSHGIPTFDISEISTKGPIEIGSIGNTGNIVLSVNFLNILDGAYLQTYSAFSSGAIGNITIHAEDINISGINQFKYETYLNAGVPEKSALSSSSSGIDSKTLFRTPSPNKPLPERGMVSITSNNVSLSSGGYISTSNNGSADSGDISIITNLLNISPGSYITSSATVGEGNAGAINIKATDISIYGSDERTVTSGIISNTNKSGGTAGNINIDTISLNLSKNATITSETKGNSAGGNITIDSSGFIHLSNNSSVTAKASEPSTADAGNITVTTGVFVLDKSEISTSAISGRGGDITINADNLVITEDSIINAVSKQSVSGRTIINSNSDIVSSLEQLPDNTRNIETFIKDACSFKGNYDSSFFISNNLTNISQNLLLPSNYGAKYLITSDLINKKSSQAILSHTSGSDTPVNTIATWISAECYRSAN